MRDAYEYIFLCLVFSINKSWFTRTIISFILREIICNKNCARLIEHITENVSINITYSAAVLYFPTLGPACLNTASATCPKSKWHCPVLQ